MKCKNCSWPNRPGEKNCIKCGAPLVDSPAMPAQAPQPMANPNVAPLPGGAPRQDHNPTVVNFNPGANGPAPAPRPMGQPMGQPMQQPAPQPMRPMQQGAQATRPMQPQMPMQQPPQQPMQQQRPMPQPQQVRPQMPQQPQMQQPRMPQPMQPLQPEADVCPRCKYKLRPGMNQCPNCSYQLTPARPGMGAPVQNQQPANPAAPNQPGVAHRPTVVGFPETQQPQNQPAQKEAFQQRQPNPAPAGAQRPAPANHRGTVNVYTAAAPETEPKFSLNPVQKVNEPAAPAALEFKGQEAILNRDNTDPDNLSITSRQQASIAHRNGKWVITDLSDQQTTFVHPAKTGQELHEGDVILLGNRLFVFHEQ